MDITPRHETVAGLFGQIRIFRVPKYQRHYAWTTEEIGDLQRDLDECLKARKAEKPKQHFFGGLVTVSQPHNGSAQKLEVIDGQQRLASFVLLVAQLERTMRNLADTLNPEAEQELKAFLQGRADILREGFLRFDDTVSLKVENVPRLQLSKPDCIFFEQLIDGSDPDATERESHRLLKTAYTSLGKYLEALVNAETDNTAKALLLENVVKVLETDWTVIHMETSKLTYAYNLFQVLNDRGVGLTEGELLRAKVLEILDGVATPDQQNRAEACWDEILGEAPGRVDEVLRWIYASHTGKRPGKTTLFDEFLAYLIPTHEQKLSKKQATQLVSKVENLKTDFKKTALILDGAWPYPVGPTVTAWDRDRLGMLIKELKHTNCMPLLIAAIDLKPKQFSDIVQVLERFVFRYKIVANAHIGPVTSAYNKQAVALRANPATYKTSTLQKELKKLIEDHASDSRFSTNLSELEYSTIASNKAIKYFLMTLEHYARWYHSGATGKPTCKDKTRVLDFSNTTLEHIHPQNASPANTTLDKLVNTLGNLTILGPSDNNAVGNKPFAQKKQILAQSTTSLNKKLAETPVWDVAALDARKQELIAMALKVFVV